MLQPNVHVLLELFSLSACVSVCLFMSVCACVFSGMYKTKLLSANGDLDGFVVGFFLFLTLLEN